MTFDQASVNALFNAAESAMLKLGTFRSVNTHEPKSAPGSGLRLSIWVDTIVPVPRGSGLSATSGSIILLARAYGNMLQKPEDEIDPRLTAAASSIINAFSTDFTLDGTIRHVDLLGMYGQALKAQAGYLTIASTVYRIMTVTVPCIVNDLWDQVPL